MKFLNNRRFFIIFSITLYTLSLFLPAYNGTKSENQGFFLLLIGWINLMHGGANFAWLANLMIWFSWVKKSFVASVVAVIFCLFFLLFDKIAGVGICGSGFLDSYSCDEPIKEINVGYYLWTMSAIIMLIGNTNWTKTKLHLILPLTRKIQSLKNNITTTHHENH